MFPFPDLNDYFVPWVTLKDCLSSVIKKIKHYKAGYFIALREAKNVLIFQQK